jgi:GNAT superfamily N-acetyltransferase
MADLPGFRRADERDIAAATDTITSAFAADPVWGRVFGLATGPGGSGRERDLDTYRSWWRLFVETAVTYDWVWVTQACEAVTVWIPPGCPEFGPEQEERAELLIDTLPAPDQRYLHQTLELFEAAPPEAPHFYLSLLGTHRDHRGRGIGMTLLNHTLAELDADGHAAYLESTNPANLDRYRSVGFTDLAGFSLPDDGPYVTTMWRPGRHDHDGTRLDRPVTTTGAEER